jgi:hypothetical protein
MTIPLEGLDHVRNFLRLDFLFSGLEVSSTAVFAARLLVLVTLGGGLLWASVRITVKCLECIQAFLGGLNRLPGSFFLLLLFMVPLSPNSVGARWTGYLLLVLCLVGVAGTGALLVVLWKYGVDQALRLIHVVRPASQRAERNFGESSVVPDNEVGSVMDPASSTRAASVSYWARST